MRLQIVLGLVVLLAAQHALALAAAPIEIVAAENFYGDVAEQIGGADVKVTSILSDPAVDPHLFEASPSVARVISGARVVVFNGIDYDPWMATLLAASPVINRRTIIVASLAARKIGDNPHVWYDTQIMLGYAAVLTEVLAAIDPAHATDFRQRLAQFQTAIQPVQSKIAMLRDRLACTPVTAPSQAAGLQQSGDRSDRRQDARDCQSGWCAGCGSDRD